MQDWDCFSFLSAAAVAAWVTWRKLTSGFIASSRLLHLLGFSGDFLYSAVCTKPHATSFWVFELLWTCVVQLVLALLCSMLYNKSTTAQIKWSLDLSLCSTWNGLDFLYNVLYNNYTAHKCRKSTTNSQHHDAVVQLILLVQVVGWQVKSMELGFFSAFILLGCFTALCLSPLL